MSSPPHNPAALGPASRNLQSLFNTLASLTNAVQSIARDIQEGIEELANSGINTNANNNIVIAGTANPTIGHNAQENNVNSLLTDLGLGHIGPNPTAQPNREITPAVTHYLESLAMLPQSTRDASLRAYFQGLRDFTGQLPQEMFPREVAPHRQNDRRNTRRAAEATGSQQPRATRMASSHIPPVSAPSPVPAPQPTSSDIRQPAPIRMLQTRFQPIITETAWEQLAELDNACAGVIVHFISTNIPDPSPIVISHLEFNITVIRDWQDEYLVLPGDRAPEDIVQAIMDGRLTTEMVLEENMVEGAQRMSAHSVAHIEIEYRAGEDERQEAPVAGPSGLSTRTRRYTPETPEQPPRAGPSNVPRSPSRHVSPVSSAALRREQAQPYPSAAFRARPTTFRSPAPSPQAPVPAPSPPSRFAEAIARINANNEKFGTRKPSELYRREVPFIGDRRLRRQDAITEDDILISDPRHGGMGELQRTIHARNPPRHSAPGTRVPLRRSGALDQDAILRMSRGSNLQETVVEREEHARRRRENHLEEVMMAEAARVADEVWIEAWKTAKEKRKGKKRARSEDEEEEEEVKAEKPVSRVPKSPAKRQKRAAVKANPSMTIDTTPVAGPSSAAVHTPNIIEQAQPRRSTRQSRRPLTGPTTVVPLPAPRARQPKKKAAGSGSKGKGK